MTHTVHEVPLHDLKIIFWFAARPPKVIWPVLFRETINNYWLWPPRSPNLNLYEEVLFVKGLERYSWCEETTFFWKSKHNTLRKTDNTSRQELCHRLNIFRICKAYWEAGGWPFMTFYESWTAGKKQIQYFWWMQTSYTIKPLEQISCFRNVTSSIQHSTVNRWNTQMSLLSNQTTIWSISTCITNFSQCNSD
jgi:hypothetical protein